MKSSKLGRISEILGADESISFVMPVSSVINSSISYPGLTSEGEAINNRAIFYPYCANSMKYRSNADLVLLFPKSRLCIELVEQELSPFSSREFFSIDLPMLIVTLMKLTSLTKRAQVDNIITTNEVSDLTEWL